MASRASSPTPDRSKRGALAFVPALLVGLGLILAGRGHVIANDDQFGGKMATPPGQEPGQSVEARTLRHVTMQEAVDALREQRIPVCFEQVPLSPERASRRADGSIEYERTHFDVVIPAGSVPEALDALIAADPTYRWEQVGTQPTYTIYPVQDSALSWTVPSRDLAGVDWIDAIRGSGIDEHDISLFPRGLERQPRVTLDDFPAHEDIARRWLSLVVDHVGQGRYWNLAGMETARSLVIGQVPVAEAG